MKKIVIVVFALLPMLAMAQVGNNNAQTAEAFIGACPDLPSAQTMAGNGDDNFTQTIKKLFRQIEEIQQADAQQQADVMMSQANKDLERQMGFSIEDAANDNNPKVKKSIFGKAKEQLRKFGINKDPETLSQTGLSEAEKNAIVESQMQKETGLSMAEAQKLQGMSNEEIMAYMQANPEMADRMMKQGQQQAKKNQGFAMSTANREKKRQQYQKQLEELTAPEKEMDELYLREKADIAQKTAEKWEACEASFPAKTGRMQVEEGDDGWISVWTEAEQKEVDRLKQQCSIECWTLWRNAVSQQLGRIKTLLPNAYKANEVSIRMSKEVDGIDLNPNAPLVLANKYLETAREYASGYPCDSDRH